MLSRAPFQAALVLTLAAVASNALAQNSQTKPPPPANPKPETRPYDPKLMRLSEILGALTYMRGLCEDKDSEDWRGRMQALLEAEGTSPARKDRLAGAYNQGLRAYSLSYRTCTANARVVIQRFLGEGEALAKAIENRYRAS